MLCALPIPICTDLDQDIIFPFFLQCRYPYLHSRAMLCTIHYTLRTRCTSVFYVSDIFLNSTQCVRSDADAAFWNLFDTKSRHETAAVACRLTAQAECTVKASHIILPSRPYIIGASGFREHTHTHTQCGKRGRNVSERPRYNTSRAD